MLRPMGFAELLDTTFRSLRGSFPSIWWFFFLLHTPFCIFIIGWIEMTDSTESLRSMLIGSWVFLSLYFLLVFPLFQNVCTQVVLRQIKKPATRFSWQSLVLLSLNQLGKLYMVSSLVFIGLFLASIAMVSLLGGLLFLFFPGWPLTTWLGWSIVLSLLPNSYLWIRTSLVLPVVIHEGGTMKQVIQRSWLLTHQTYGFLLTRWLILSLFGFPVIMIWFMLLDSYPLSPMMFLLPTLTLNPLICVVFSLCLSHLYVDQRVRKEAFDLQMQLAQLEQRRDHHQSRE